MEYYNKYQEEIQLDLFTNVTMVHNFETGENSIVHSTRFKSFFDVPDVPVHIVNPRVGAPGPSGAPGVVTGPTGPVGVCGAVGICGGSTGSGEDYEYYLKQKAKPYANELITTKDLPKIFTLRMILRPKQEQRTDIMYQEINEFLSKLPGAQIESVAPVKRTRPDFTRPKAEFLIEVEKITQRNEEARKLYDQLSKQLTEMSVHVGKFKQEYIPTHYYETYDYYDYSLARFDISCHCKVEAYDALVGMGLVLKALKPHHIETLKHKKYNQRLIDALPSK